MIRTPKKARPRGRAITVPVLDLAQGTAELEELARGRMSGEVSRYAERVMLSALARDGLRGAALAGAWDSYLEALRVREALETGHATWAEFMPELADADRQEQAFSIATQEELAAALAILSSRTQLAGSQP